MENGELDIQKQVRRGLIAGAFSYMLWGSFPLYWKLLDAVNPIEIICQRIIWCFVFTALVCFFLRKDFVALLKDQRARRILTLASIFITANWSIYIFAVHINHVVEAALGYYINPLFAIMLGLLVFKEKLSPIQWIAVGLCCVGIGFFATNYGSFPWISILLAVTFAIYGAIKKKGGYPAVETIAVESLIMLPVAVVVNIALAIFTGSWDFLGDVTTAEGWSITLLLIGGGIVTAAPLILFAIAANSIPLVFVGFLQYISPTISLLLGVFAFGEPFTLAHGVCFGCIWLGLILVAVETIIQSLRTKPGKLTPLEAEEAKELSGESGKVDN